MDEREWRENRGPDEPLDLCYECGVSAGTTRWATRRDTLAAVAPTAAEREAARLMTDAENWAFVPERGCVDDYVVDAVAALVAYVRRVRALVEGAEK